MGAAAVAGFLLAPSSGRAPAPTTRLVRSVSAGPITVSYPAGWKRGAAIATPHLSLANEIVLNQVNPAGGTLVLGTSPTADQSLLPASLRAALPSVPAQQQVVLGETRFYRYLGVTPSGENAPQTVYAVPTTGGTVIGICGVQGAGAGFLSGCERVLGSMRLNGGRVLGLGPSTQLAAGLTSIITSLNAGITGAGARLRAATSPRAQAAAANELATAYAHAASAVQRVPGAGTAADAARSLARALRMAAAGYDALARAAAHGNKGAYGTAGLAIAVNADAVNAAIRQFGKLGYTIG